MKKLNKIQNNDYMSQWLVNYQPDKLKKTLKIYYDRGGGEDGLDETMVILFINDNITLEVIWNDSSV